jgi:ankyrin repeat protein
MPCSGRARTRNEFAFSEAAAFGHAEILRLLLSAGADVHAHNDSALCAAADGGHAEAARVLLEAGADYSVHNHAPLRRALANGHTQVARILREAGSYNPEAPGEDPVSRHREAIFRP